MGLLPTAATARLWTATGKYILSMETISVGNDLVSRGLQSRASVCGKTYANAETPGGE